MKYFSLWKDNLCETQTYKIKALSVCFLVSCIVLTLTGCCKRDGMWTTWCPETTEVGSSNQPLVVISSRALGEADQCFGTCGEHRDLYNVSGSTISVSWTEIVHNLQGQTISNTTKGPIILSAGKRHFIGCTKRREHDGGVCEFSYTFSIRQVNKVNEGLASISAFSTDSTQPMLMQDQPALDCVSICDEKKAISCRKLDITEDQAMQSTVRSYVDTISQPLKDSSATVIQVDDLLKASGADQDICKRSNTTLSPDKFVNTAAKQCFLFYGQEANVIITLPPEISGKRNVENAKIVLSFDESHSPELTIKSPLLSTWSGNIDKLVLDDVNGVAYASVGNKCIKASWK